MAKPIVAGESRGSLISLVVILAVAGIVLVTQTGPALGLGTVLVAALVLLSFLHTEFGLHLILISMLLSPEIVVGAAGIVLGKPEMKGDALVVRMEDLVLVAITAAWLARLLVFRVMGLLRKTPLNPPIAAYTVIAVLATLLGFWAGKVPPVPGFFFVAKYIEFFILFYVMATHLTNEAQLTRLLRTMWGTCIVACVIALAQIPTGQRVSAPFEGPQGEPNTFGGYLVLMIALALGQGLTLAKPKQRLRWLALAGLILVPLLFTLSRTSWLAAIPMLLTLILLSPRRHILIAAVLLVIVGGAAITPDAVLERINYTFYDPEDRGDVWVAGTQLDTSTAARFASWRTGFKDWVERPVFGYGVRGYMFMDAQYFRVLTETGIVGLLAFGWLLVALGRLAWKTYTRLRGTRYEGLALGYLAGYVAMITHCIGANTFIIVRIMEPWWFCTAMMLVLPIFEGARAAAPADGVPVRARWHSAAPTPLHP